jgi:hypothetical protein
LSDKFINNKGVQLRIVVRVTVDVQDTGFSLPHKLQLGTWVDGHAEKCQECCRLIYSDFECIEQFLC